MTNSPFLRSARIAGGLAVCAVLALGSFAPASHAQDHRGEQRHDHDRRGDDRRGWDGGGYYVAPPVVYGSPYYAPYYAPPPVVYGPPVGIALPGIVIGIH